MVRKRKLTYLILILTVLAFTGLMIYKDIIAGDKFIMGDVKRLHIDKELVPVSINSIIFNGNDIMVEAEGPNIRAKNMEGTILWSMKLDGNVSSIISCGEDIVINLENKSIATISKSGELLWQYEMVVPASDIYGSDKGLILIQYKENGYNYFEIFNMKGVKYSQGSINTAQAVSFDGNGDKNFTISLLDVSSEKIVTRLATYNNKGEIIWAQDFENVIIPCIKYNLRGDLIAVTDKSIMRFRADGKLIKKDEFFNPLIMVSLGNELVVAVQKNKDFYDVFIFDSNLKQIGTAAVKSKPHGIFAGDKYILIYDKDNLTMLSRQGSIIALYESNIDINSAYMCDNTSIYIVSNRKLQRLAY
ncbi:DUF5711 family protein [Lutispora thermophila]|uniref:PQQ-like domain-containing protein n=1 Tax=Lutispora thermophila DSM 19022 TaxID=1122184 RepID=A0A1M6HY95_9FIRM|nr:DUF5711 family protein [Lutispora thermophila]SHJ27202.1 hypothetical protein SAMN02745176_02989 [Lutispora thermophila DSM 19022]